MALCLLFAASAAFAAQTRQPAGPLVLVLPYQVNVGPEMESMKQDWSTLLADRIRARGMRVVPIQQARAILREGNVGTLDLAKAQQLGAAARAQVVVYGVFNQLGEGFSLDSRVVPVGAGATPQAVTIQKKDALAVAAAAEELAVQVAANAPAPEGQATRPGQPGGGLSDVQVRGLRVLDPDVVLMRLSIRKGDNPDAAAINEEVKRVWEMGYFSDVQAAMSPGNVLVFTVVEKPRIDNIIVEGSDKVDKDDVLAALSTKTGSVLNETLLADDLQRVTELYRKEGFYLANVTQRVEPRPGGAGAVLYFTVTEGNKLYIREVIVDGLSQIKRGDLDDYLALQPRGFLSWFTGKGVLKDEYLERDSNAIAAFALNEGFIDVQVSAPKVEYKNDGIYITFTVSEGPRYKVGDITFAGEVISDDKQMLEVVQLDEHKQDKGFFSLSVMQEDIKRVTQYYGDQGYAFAEVDTRIAKDPNGAPVVNVAYVVNKKQKVFIRRTMLEGNSKTRDNVILRELRLADGDPYDGAKMRRSVERLNRLRYFSAVDTELVPTDDPEEVDLKIKVKEGNTGSLMAGIGYSTMYDVGVSASIMERNLFGRGYWVQLQGFFSYRRTTGMLSFTNPRIYDTDLLGGADIYYTRDYWNDYTKDTVGSSVRFAYPLGEYTTVGWGYRLERYNMYGIAPWASPSIRDFKGINWTSAINLRAVRDTTDVTDRPTKGTITRLGSEYGGSFLGGTDNFVKAMADWQAFYTWRPNNTFHVRGRLSGVFQNTNDLVPVFERFYMGGMDSVRGYSYTRVSPRDPKYGDIIGGDRMGVFNLEYVWTFQKDLGLAIVPFVDGGFNIDSRKSSTLQDVGDKMVYSVGLELRWRSPMGDLRIAYGVPLSKDYSNSREAGRFEFSMGQFF